MYEELAKALRCCADDNIPCKSCPRCAQCAKDMNMNSLFPKAADAIEERCQQVDKFMEESARLYAKLPRWIPVTERLPDNEDYVLVCIHSRWNKEICIPLVAYYDRFCSQWKLSWDNSDIYNITHWMPLPEPPEEKTE